MSSCLWKKTVKYRINFGISKKLPKGKKYKMETSEINNPRKLISNQVARIFKKIIIYGSRKCFWLNEGTFIYLP